MARRDFLSVSMTYERVTPESAECGDAEERGFMVGESCPFAFPLPVAEAMGEQVDYAMSAHDALRLIRGNHCCYSASVSATGASFYTSEPQEQHYHDGATVEHTIHVRGPARLIRALVRAAKPHHVHV